MQQPVDVVSAWGALAARAAADATSLLKLVALLPPPASDMEWGRYAGGAALSPFANRSSASLPAGTALADLELQAAAKRASVATAIAAAKTAAGNLAASTAVSFAAAIAAVAAAVLAAITDPADALRLLPALAAYTPVPLLSAAPFGQRQAAIVRGIGDLCRRAAIAALAQASAAYQPRSQQDAAAMRDKVCAIIEAELLIAGDQGEDATFLALKSLRAKVSTDLTARGADLAEVVTVAVPAPLPALLLANRLYRDSTRAAELVAEADPIHPGFMPVRFAALSG